MRDYFEGEVIIVALTMQAGTIVSLGSNSVWVLLRNNDIWCGSTRDIRFPQDEADLSACVIDVDRFINR